MAVSTKTLQSMYDVLAAKGIPDPRSQAQGYGDILSLELGSQVMADLITERFNWKFNRGVAAPFLTNSWQQDYPQPAQASGSIAWGEDCDICDINSTTFPKPLNWDGAITWRRQLTRSSLSARRPRNIAWMYNRDLSWGTWPGAGKTYSPLISAQGTSANPIMNFIDVHGNYLILTGFGVTGNSQPSAAASSPEGTTVNDGTCVWTVVSGDSQGFRIDTLPGQNSVVYQITPIYQLEPPEFAELGQLLTPIPDSFSRHFERGLEAQCFEASPNPNDRQRQTISYADWLKSMVTMVSQGNKNPDIYRMVPSTSPVEDRYIWHGPRTADDPV